ncbi:MAG: type II secretion system protein [Vampirovibrionales bacterium]
MGTFRINTIHPPQSLCLPGFTLVELALVMIIVAIIAGVGLLHFSQNIAQAEEAILNTTGSQLRSASASRVAHDYSVGSLDFIEFVSNQSSLASEIELVTLPSQCVSAIAANNITVSCTHRETTYTLNPTTGQVSWAISAV